LLTLVDESAIVAPGISLRLTGGHTRGHQVLFIESRGERAVHLGDLLHSARHRSSAPAACSWTVLRDFLQLAPCRRWFSAGCPGFLLISGPCWRENQKMRPFLLQLVDQHADLAAEFNHGDDAFGGTELGRGRCQIDSGSDEVAAHGEQDDEADLGLDGEILQETFQVLMQRVLPVLLF
ncbi:MAG: hypothetical protein ABIJ50_06335, partial [Pseudomonadota bacterium]